MSQNTDIAVSASGLSKSFDGVVALRDLSLAVRSGSVTGLIGPNGAGKTTFLNVASGFWRADGGSIKVFGNEITDVSPERIARLGVARTFQNIRLLGQMTAIENVLVADRRPALRSLCSAVFQRGRVRKSQEEARQAAMNHLRLVGLEGKELQLAMSLSHGQRKLLELARALACRPAVLLLDEPAAGLFPKATSQVEQVLLTLRKAGTTIVVVEHRMDFVMRVCDTVIVLSNGAKLAEGTPEAIRRNKQVRQVYLGGGGSLGS